MLYIITEHFHKDKVKQLYHCFAEKGRMLPEGVSYINSWINEDVSICYQAMESDATERIEEWIGNWNDLSDFEVIPIITSAQAKEKVFCGMNDLITFYITSLQKMKWKKYWPEL